MTQPARPVTRLTTSTRTNLDGILKGDGSALGTVAVGANLSYDGTTLSAANQTTAPGGSSGQIQYNSGGAFAGAAALTYATSGTHLTATAQAGTVVPLAAQAATGQTANLQEWRDSSGTVRSWISKECGLGFSDGLGGTWYMGPSPSNVGQFIFTNDSGSGFSQFTVGTFWQVAPAGGGGFLLGDFFGSPNGFSVAPHNPAQASDSVFYVDFPTGRVGVNNGAASPAAQLEVFAGAATTPGVRVKAAASQTANLQEWQDSAGAVLSAVDATGALKLVSLADASAPNSSLYYSTTAGKLVWKDAGGVVNNLY